MARFVRFAEDSDVSDGFDDAAFDHLPELEERSFWFRARNELIAWAMARYFPGAGSMLEVGCGTGFVLRHLRGALPRVRLVGGELSEAGLTTARRRVADAELYQMDARRIPFEDEFDVTAAFDVLEHVTEDELVLAQLHQATRPGGGLIVTVPQHPWLWSAADTYAHHKRRYGRHELLRKMETAGWRVERVTSFVTLLLPAMAASRLARRDSHGFDPKAESELAEPTAWILGRLLAIERRMIAKGLNLPVGGSLLAIGIRHG